MASSASSHQHQNYEFNAFSGVEPAGKRRRVSESSTVYDVFINHRGPDVKQTLASELYKSLQQLGIKAFLDSEEKEIGNSFTSTITTAIRSAKVHIAIFSERYAESPWCLAELTLMLRTKAKIIPVFYQVKPSDLRYIEKGIYAGAFKKYEENGRYLNKLSQWKEALQSLSFIAGEEFDSDCKNIVVAVQEEVKRKTNLDVAEYPVGLKNLVKDFERNCLDEPVQDFENLCGLQKPEDQVKVVGIFGMGGVGKTTLAKELYNRNKSNYRKAIFLFEVRKGLPSSQLKLLQTLYDQKILSFTSTDEGTSHLKDSLERSQNLDFLIVVDDVDHVQQLKDLLVMDILKKSVNTLIIVTTRDAGLLVTAGITDTYNMKGLDRNYAGELFCWHAFGRFHPDSGYEALVEDFRYACGGLPLSLQVLGRHVRHRDQSYWKLELSKASKMLPGDVKKSLKISFDALDDEQKQVFMDIACFFVGESLTTAQSIWEASGWNGEHALQTLKEKCLVEETSNSSTNEISLRMHDHLRDLGREMADKLRCPLRLWHPQHLKSLESRGFRNILTTATANVRCFHSFFDKSMGFQVAFLLGQSDSFGETSASLACLQLESIHDRQKSSIPCWIPLQNLHYLGIRDARLKTLWKNSTQAPARLKELSIFRTDLEEFPDLSEISNSVENVCFQRLEKIKISNERSVSSISISGIQCPSLKSIILEYMKNLEEVNFQSVRTLRSLDITNCKKVKKLTGTSDLTILMLRIMQCPELEELTLGYSSCLEKVIIDGCQNLETLPGISNLAKLVELEIRGCGKLQFEELMLGHLNFLERIKIDGLKSLRSLLGISYLTKLVELVISGCGKLEFDHLCLSGLK